MKIKNLKKNGTRGVNLELTSGGDLLGIEVLRQIRATHAFDAFFAIIFAKQKRKHKTVKTERGKLLQNIGSAVLWWVGFDRYLGNGNPWTLGWMQK